MDSLTEGKKAAYAMEVFAGDGEMCELMRRKDWSKTSLSSVENWPQSLKTSIRIILGSRYPMFVWWGQELLNFYNDAYISVLGKRHPQALGESARNIWAELWHSVGPFAEDVLNRGNPSWNEEFLEIMERNGYPEETYFTFSYSPISNDDGGVGGIFCACTEDTRRVLDDRRLRTLRELGAETAKAKTVNEACNISTSVLANNLHDIPFALIYLLENESFAQLASTTNLAVGTLASPTAIELTSVLKSADCWSLNSVLATGESRVIKNLVEQFGPLPGGAWTESPNTAIALPLTGAGQEILGAIIVGISPLRPFDDDYQGFCDLVAGQVTSAIANARAYESERKRAEALAELDQAKTAFFSNVSHEFRTPLTLILNPLEQVLALKYGSLLPEQHEQLDIVQRNAIRLFKLVNTLLDFSQIEAGRIQAVYEPTNLAGFTADLASVFRSVIEQASLQLIVDCPPLCNLLYVDREMWEKIVLNLISNAFKFTLVGEIAVSLRPIGDKVELKIRDTGIGIAPEELPRIFERFHRLRGVKARSHEGSGIGLALVTELVQLHGGTVEVESVLGKGTTFTVTLPTGSSHLPSNQISTSTLASTSVCAAPYVEEAQQWQKEENLWFWGRHKVAAPKPPPIKPSQFSTARILLVDDNADMRDYVARLLREQWQVTAVANGVAALAAVYEQLPDLVLTDVMMPEMDGFQLLSALRADPKTKGIPIILLSARAGEEAAIEGLQAGADDYLIKPFSARELLTRVESHLQMVRLRQELSSNHLKDEFLATVTHELHAPLVTILGWTRLLRSKELDKLTALRALDTIERSAKNQAKLIEDLLDISTIISGQVCLQSQPVKLTKIIEEVINTMSSNAKEKEINIVKTLQATSQQRDTVLADRDRLQQIVRELLANAIKFTSKEGVVEIRLDTIDSLATIQIKDTGVGISSEFLPDVFDRFTQAEVPSRHTPGGLGLGLAIARQLVELHGGTIEAASDGIGRGATFTVKLPLI
ncbi:hybrid sensor histidine kinase/response regulator [Nostoc sp.]|uniref:hybrid sensor histidine kinase/response regulator n=1 Tax=Nostoc sp. TaxID=1180 RepID=UPI002FFB3234